MSFQDLAKEITVGLALAYTPAGLAIDIKDTLAAAYDLHNDPNNDDHKLEMVICLIGWIQGPGDALKIGIRGVSKRPELLFDMVRFILQKLGQHADAEKWLDAQLKASVIGGAISGARKQVVKYIRESDWIADEIIPYVETAFNTVQNNLTSFVMLLARKVAHWKTKSSKTTQTNAVATTNNKVKETPSKDQTTKGTDSNKNQSSGQKRTTTVNALIKTLSKADIGLVGEHMADYWVVRELNLTAVQHDNGKSPLKISQSGDLHKLNVSDINGTGIDSVWKTNYKNLGRNATKTYAVIEAKCSGIKATATPAGLLNDLTKKPKQNTGGSGKRDLKQKPLAKTEANQQMSKEWVDKRLDQAKATQAYNKYTRHLVFFGIANPTVTEHFNAFMSKPEAPVASKHTRHVPSQQFNEHEIDQAINKRLARSSKK